MASSGTTIVRVEPRRNIADVGETFSVNITINEVRNLYGIDLKLQWNASILRLVRVDVQLGVESHPDGVLHEDIWVAKNETNNDVGSYWLAATSYKGNGDVSPPSFNGSGNIIITTFNVTSRGNTKLSLETTLADKPLTGETASPIPHKTLDGFFGPIHIFPSPPDTLFVGEKVNISGFIIPSEPNVEIRIEYRLRGKPSWISLANVTTNQQGNYFYIWQPREEGTYEIRTKAVFEDREETSNPLFITVEAETISWQFFDAFLVAVSLIVIVATAVVIYFNRRKKAKRIVVSSKSFRA
jgi:hypothetical protein